MDFLQPIADLQQRTRCDLVPLGVQAEVMGAVQRSGGIAALSEQQRNAYVDDVGAFVRYPKQTAAFDVWAERVVARTYKNTPRGPGGRAEIRGLLRHRPFYTTRPSRRSRRATAARTPPHYLFAWSPTTT